MVSLVLAGAGGYGALYVKELLNRCDVKLCGIVEPYFDTVPDREKILAAGIPVYSSLEDFYKEQKADLAVLAVPTYLHRDYSLTAMKHGSHVLCEKPAAGTVQEVLEMAEAEKEYGRFAAIGFQWSYSETILNLKKDVLAGNFGAPEKLSTIISWARNRAYFARGGGWGGSVHFKGKTVLDSIASNACGHYLHNMLFLTGPSLSESAEAVSVSGKCLRANSIENFDTCLLNITLDNGAACSYIASHATGAERDPEFVYRFEKAEIRFEPENGYRAVAYFNDGTEKDYGDPFKEALTTKLNACIRAAEEGTRPVCTAETALPHVKLIEKIYNEIPVENFPEDQILEKEGFGGVYVPGLMEEMNARYAAESGK